MKLNQKKNSGMKGLFLLLALLFTSTVAQSQTVYYDQTREGFLVFHPIRTDQQGNILPWNYDELGRAYHDVIMRVWSFWDNMRRDINGLPYYMNHQVWRPGINDPRGIGGDQLSMVLSSWQLLYQYYGSEQVKENMKFIADYYITHSLSPDDAEWPNVPYPYNNFMYSGAYQGDMVQGIGYTQPDKAGSFGHELVKLYKLTGKRDYLNTAVDIANALAKHTVSGDEDNSPLPFKVNAMTGETGDLFSNTGSKERVGKSSYTTNWTGTMTLFTDLIALNEGNTESYKKAFDIFLNWMKRYPLQNNKWGPFFEDIPGWSDTQINAVTFARYMMENQSLFPDWRKNVKNIFNWVYENLGNEQWKKYNVTVVNEQTAYQTPGNSHTSRQAAAEIQYAALTEDHSNLPEAIRRLNWATYMVDDDGKNCYPRDEVWFTDGYGDYVRHYLRSMAAIPSLAPSDGNHIVSSSSILKQVDYAPYFNNRLVPIIPRDELDKVLLYYESFDKGSTETLRLTAKPSKITAGGTALTEKKNLKDGDGWIWTPLKTGGVLTVAHKDQRIKIYK